MKTIQLKLILTILSIVLICFALILIVGDDNKNLISTNENSEITLMKKDNNNRESLITNSRQINRTRILQTKTQANGDDQANKEYKKDLNLFIVYYNKAEKNYLDLRNDIYDRNPDLKRYDKIIIESKAVIEETDELINGLKRHFKDDNAFNKYISLYKYYVQSYEDIQRMKYDKQKESDYNVINVNSQSWCENIIYQLDLSRSLSPTEIYEEYKKDKLNNEADICIRISNLELKLYENNDVISMIKKRFIAESDLIIYEHLLNVNIPNNLKEAKVELNKIKRGKYHPELIKRHNEKQNEVNH